MYRIRTSSFVFRSGLEIDDLDGERLIEMWTYGSIDGTPRAGPESLDDAVFLDSSTDPGIIVGLETPPSSISGTHVSTIDTLLVVVLETRSTVLAEV